MDIYRYTLAIVLFKLCFFITLNEINAATVFTNRNLDNYQKPSPKIIGGQETIPHKYPFAAFLIIDGRFYCGGAIIDNKNIVTAAHCLDDAEVIEVIVGAHDVSSNESTQQRSYSVNYYKHESWNSFLRTDDIGLVYLDQYLIFDESVQPAVLAIDEPQIATAIGWGYTSPNGHDISNTLQELENLIIIPDRTCETFYTYIAPSVVCVDSGSNGVCTGDSGSPLVNDANELVGVLAFYYSGCQSDLPYGYSSIKDFNSWIESNKL